MALRPATHNCQSSDKSPIPEPIHTLNTDWGVSAATVSGNKGDDKELQATEKDLAEYKLLTVLVPLKLY